MIHHIKRATRHLIFWSLVATAIGLTGLRLLLSGIDGYKVQIADHIGELMGAPVKIGHIGAKMRGFNPELVLTEIGIESLTAHGKPAIQLREIRLGINLIDSLVSRDLLSSSWVTLVGAKLSVIRKQDGSFVVVGLKTSDGQPLWLLQGRKYEVLQSEVVWLDEKNKVQPLKFAAVDMAIINDGKWHRINILMKLPQKYGDELRLSMNLEGNVSEPSAIRGVVYAEGNKINPAELISPDLPFDIKINSGSGDFKIWSNWQQSQPVSIKGTAQFQPLKLSRPDQGTLAINKLYAEFDWKLNDISADAGKQWQLNIPHFLLDTAPIGKSASNKLLTGAFNMNALLGNDSFSPKFGVFFDQLDLQKTSALVQFFAPLQDGQMKQFKQAQLKGALENFSLFADLTGKTVAVNGNFSQLGFASMNAAPGLENLTGTIKGTDKQGSVSLLTENALFKSAGLFRTDLGIKKLEGSVDWRQTDENWSLSSNKIVLDSPDIQTQSKLKLMIPKNKVAPFLDLQSAFAISDATKAKHYLPVGIMGSAVVDWLDHAFIAGRVSKGNLLITGNLNEFPFSSGEGVFETGFEGSDGELAYHPEWPHLTGLNAKVLFFKDSLRVNLHGGQSNKVKINQAEVTIPSLSLSKQLLVKGSLESGIADVLGFLQQTPLKSRIDPVLDAITPQGNTKITLDMKIPLVEGAPAKVDGTAELNNARLNITSLDLPVSQLQGQLKFNENGIYSDVIRASALARPIQITIKNPGQETAIKVSGSAAINTLQKQFKMPGWDLAKGSADYLVQLKLPHDDAIKGTVEAPELTVQSSLVGVALDLPGLLAKTKEQLSPLSLTFKLIGKDKLLPLEISYDNKLKAALQLTANKQGIYSGHILIGDGDVAQRQESGLKVEINRDPLPLKDWLSLAAQNHKSEAASDIREIKIHSGHALWNQTEIGVFDLALKQDGNQWAGVIGSVFATGKIKIPANSSVNGTTHLDMDVLDISALKQVKFRANGDKQAVSPETMPLFNLTSKLTLWKSFDLGFLTLETERIPGGVGFKRIELVGPDGKLSSSGDWTLKGTHTLGRIEIPKAGQLFTKLGITKDLAETSATIDFTVDWNAAPYQVSLSALKGQIDVKFKNGRITSIEPGFGRVLGVLAMAQWIKRLQLDFSDVYKEGLSFNTIKGHFDLVDGKAVTENLVVDAVPAKITITGNTDLIAHTVDHVVNVAPKSADAVPIAGTIMGKMANLVAESLTGKNQDGFLFGSQYLVKGEWGNAEIIPLHENDGLLQKTWDGITGFPWLEQPNKQR